MYTIQLRPGLIKLKKIIDIYMMITPIDDIQVHFYTRLDGVIANLAKLKWKKFMLEGNFILQNRFKIQLSTEDSIV